MVRKNNGDKALSENLLRIIGRRGMTYDQVAVASGLSCDTVSAVACRKRAASIRTLRKLRAGLGCTWDDLLGDGSLDER
jgi:transcriptional regulator with XRE-family HTH domain